jgi:hypothetical protein
MCQLGLPLGVYYLAMVGAGIGICNATSCFDTTYWPNILSLIMADDT